MGDESMLERILNGQENPKDLPLALLQSITNDFSEDRKIGQGGFGVVYKGILRNGIIVAVKRMSVNEYTVDDKAFRREFSSLTKTNHQNIVRFLGFCSNTHHISVEEAGSREIKWVNVNERLLCLEYISNGSLDKHISDELRGLKWKTRYEIIIGICKGLRCLHEEKRIVHMDLKPENILLDDHMVPKITDFGLSRPNKNSHTMGLRFGTRGYLAPEYENSGKTSFECDIYSLGAIIIELVTGCKDVPDKNNVLRRWRHRWSKPPTLLQYQQVTRCINIAGRCREPKPEARPSILEIISFLVSPCFDEDDMLGIKPLELRLPSELKKEISCSIELTNDTRNCIAFNIQLPSRKWYNAQPYKGIVQPESKYVMKITVQPNVHEHDHANKFIVQSMKVSEGLRDEDITERMFEEASKDVDEVNLMVVYEPTKSQENCMSREDTNMPAEEVPEMGFLPNESGLLDASKKGGRVLLDIHPLQLRFPFEPNKLIPCQLNLTNNTDEHVDFRCVPKNPKSFLNGLSRINGSVPPNSTCIYIVTMEKHHLPPANMDTLAVMLESWVGYRSPVHKVTLTAVCEPVGKMMASEPIQPGIKVMYCRDGGLSEILSMDVHPTKPW